MTKQEKDRIQNAIRHIQTAVDVDPWAVEIAVDAMQKQIPRKPVMDYQFSEKFRKVIERTNIELAKSKTECCPVCRTSLGVSQFVKAQTGQKYGDPHCKECGQAIDWE